MVIRKPVIIPEDDAGITQQQYSDLRQALQEVWIKHQSTLEAVTDALSDLEEKLTGLDELIDEMREKAIGRKLTIEEQAAGMKFEFGELTDAIIDKTNKCDHGVSFDEQCEDCKIESLGGFASTGDGVLAELNEEINQEKKPKPEPTVTVGEG